MYMNNSGAGSSSAANLPNFPSPFFDQMSLGSMTMDYPTRHLSPGMGSARLPYQSMPSQQQQTSMFPPVASSNTKQQQMPGETFDSEKAKKKMLSMTSNLERISQMDRSSNNNTPGSGNSNQSNNMSGQQMQQPAALQQQTPSMVAPPGAQVIGSSYYGESPLLSNTMLEYATRRLSPPSSTAFLPAFLGPESPVPQQAQLGGNMDEVKMKKTSAALSNLMNAERQTQKRKETDQPSSASGNSGKNAIPATRLFAPLDQSAMMRPPPPQQAGQATPGASSLLNSNLLRAGRLSAGGADDSFFDLGFGTDFGYTFSPGEVVRTLGTPGGGIGESPMTQSMRLFPYSTPSYSSMMAPPPQAMASASSWQYQQAPTGGQRYAPSTLALDAARQHQYQQQLSTGGSKKRSKREEEADEKKKKSKKISKPEDPNEPRITSKHRGVCWYKRTKKWVVQTKVNGKRVHVGYFDDEEKAAEAYKQAVQGIQIKKALEAKQKSLENRANAGPEQPSI